MTTLAEVETIVDLLSVPDREALLRHLEASLGRRPTQPDATPREQWMRGLDALRDSIGRPTPVLTGEQILAESRGD